MGKGKEGASKGKVICAVVTVLVIITIILVGVGFKKLEPNQLGLDYSANSLTIDTKKLYRSGIHYLGVGHDFKIYPKNVMEIDMRNTRDSITARTSDGLVISIKARLLFRIIPSIERLSALWLMFKEDYSSAYRAIARGTIRDVAGTFTAFEFWQIRDNITNTMMDSLSLKLEGYHATVDSFLMSDFDLPQKFNDALAQTDVWMQEQSKVVYDIDEAKKDVETQLIRANQTVARIDIDASREANTTGLRYEAEVQRIQTAVDAETTAYQKMKAQLNLTAEELVNLVWLESLIDSGSSARKTIQLSAPSSLDL